MGHGEGQGSSEETCLRDQWARRCQGRFRVPKVKDQEAGDTPGWRKETRARDKAAQAREPQQPERSKPKTLQAKGAEAELCQASGVKRAQ